MARIVFNLQNALVILFCCFTGFRIAHSRTGNIENLLSTVKQNSVKVEILNQLVDIAPPYFCCGTSWADSVMKTLTQDEKIAQLFMVAAYSNRDNKHVDEITSLIKNYHIGGLIFMQGGPARQAALTNYYQSITKTPLMIAMDAEWGLAMRLDSVIKFPYQMALGAVQDNQLIYEMGAEVARQCRLLGVHVNFAPVADINNNQNNPVIGYRSFGENKHNVTAKGIAYMKGLQDNRVLACAKHFPGHGDTDTDSHKSLPVISHTKQRLDSIEIYPFKELIRQGLGSIMVAHIYVPALDSKKNTPSTLSKKVVTNLLRDSLGFKGLTFTDALNMGGVSQFYKPGIVDVKALLAGNDILLFSGDVPKAVNEIKKAIKLGEISSQEIDRRCRNILIAKKWLYISDNQYINMDDLNYKFNSKKPELLKIKLIESSLTMLLNKNEIVPLKALEKIKIASLSIGKVQHTGEYDKNISVFQEVLSRYTTVNQLKITGSNPDENEINLISEKVKGHDLVIIGIHGNNKISGGYGITREMNELINAVRLRSKVILIVFANPYSLKNLTAAKNADALIIAYEDDEITQSLAAQLVFGGIAAKGKLPVSTSPFSAGDGIITNASIRLKYTIPEETGVNSRQLERIDSIAIDAIEKKATPGCQVLVVKEGKVIYRKAFGNHIYREKPEHAPLPVKMTDLYDIASVTKIASTVAAAMKLSDEGKFHLDSTLGFYIPMPDTSNKRNIVIRDMLAHHARLQSWIPFWLNSLSKLSDTIYSNRQSPEFYTKVADKIFIINDYSDTIMKEIMLSPLREKNEYYYSDLGFYFLKNIIESISGEQIEDYVIKNFYAPLGLSTMGFNPMQRFSTDRIVPTENDTVFRKQLINGYVHDPGAAMLGGVGGHAGIFSNADDLAVFMQMLLQGGVYGDRRYLNSSTIKEYAKCQFCQNQNRRGAGFDRPEMDYTKEGPTCQCVSENSFGHTGFTGAMAWADPDKQIVYIFLSNRIHPDADNKKLIEMNVRTNIQKIIYEAVEKF